MRIALALPVLLLPSACYSGVIQVEPSTAPYHVTNQCQGHDSVLLLPLYQSDNMGNISYRIEHIREAKNGLPVNFRLPTSTGVPVGHILYGSGKILEGALALAPRCRLKWLDSDVLYSKTPTIDMVPASAAEWQAIVQLLRVASERFHPRLSLSELEHPDFKAEVLFRLTKDERAQIRMVLESAQ